MAACDPVLSLDIKLRMNSVSIDVIDTTVTGDGSFIVNTIDTLLANPLLMEFKLKREAAKDFGEKQVVL